MTDIHWLPITYQVTHRMKHHRIPSTRSLREDVPLRVPTVSEAEVKHVAWVSHDIKLDPSQSSYGRELPLLPDGSFDIVVFEGKLYRNVVFPGGAAFSLGQVQDFATKAKATPRSRFMDYPLGVDTLGNPRREEVEFHDYLSDDRNEQIRRAQEAAAGLLVLDGVLYKPAEEPLIEIDASTPAKVDGKSSTCVAVRILPVGIGHAKRDSALYRADEFELACSAAAVLGDRLDRPVVIDGEIEVFSSQGLSTDPYPKAIERVAAAFHSYGLSGFGDINTATIRAWCEAADILAAHRRQGADLAGVVEPLDRFVALVSRADYKLRALAPLVERLRSLPEPALEADLEALPPPL